MINEIIENLRKNNYSFTIISLRDSIIILVETSVKNKILEFYYNNNSKEPYKKEDCSNICLKVEFKDGKYEEEVKNHIINNLLVGRCNFIKSYKGTDVVNDPTHIKNNTDNTIGTIPIILESGTCTGKIDGDGTSYDPNEIPGEPFKHIGGINTPMGM
jgi:hypothetical protein